MPLLCPVSNTIFVVSGPLSSVEDVKPAPDDRKIKNPERVSEFIANDFSLIMV